MVTFMKKILLSVIVLLSILTSFIGCKFGIANDYASQELKRPDVEAIDSGIAIRLPVPSDPVVSVLIYRYEEDTETTSEKKSVIHRTTNNEEIENSDIIGYIDVTTLQKSNESSSQDFTYFFEDKNLENKKTYKYKARYTYKNTSFQYTKWSAEITSTKDLATTDYSPATITFDEGLKELTIEPEKFVKNDEKATNNYKYSIIVRARLDSKNNTELIQLFEINSQTLYLTKILPRDFLNAEGGVWIDGIIENRYLATIPEKITEEDGEETTKIIPTKIGFSKKIPVLYGQKTSTNTEGVQIIGTKIEYEDNSSGIDFSKQVVKFQ